MPQVGCVFVVNRDRPLVSVLNPEKVLAAVSLGTIAKLTSKEPPEKASAPDPPKFTSCVYVLVAEQV